MEINPRVTLKEMPQEDCVVVARFEEVPESTTEALAKHMHDGLLEVGEYRGMLALTEDEQKREVGRTAIKVLFASTYLAAAERHTATAARDAGEKEGVSVTGFLLQPSQLMSVLDERTGEKVPSR